MVKFGVGAIFSEFNSAVQSNASTSALADLGVFAPPKLAVIPRGFPLEFVSIDEEFWYTARLHFHLDK